MTDTLSNILFMVGGAAIGALALWFYLAAGRR